VTTREDSPELLRARRLGKRYALLVFVAFATGYIVLSTWEVIAGVFALDAPGQMAAHGRPDPACTGALAAFARSVDHADDAEATVAPVRAACTATSANLDALAAVERFRRAKASALAHGAEGPQRTAPLRRDLDAYLVP